MICDNFFLSFLTSNARNYTLSPARELRALTYIRLFPGNPARKTPADSSVDVGDGLYLDESALRQFDNFKSGS